MKGVRQRFEREAEQALSTAHLVASFSRIDKLKPLDVYLGRMRAARGGLKPQAPAAMFEVLKQLASRGGATMTVTPLAAPDRED